MFPFREPIGLSDLDECPSAAPAVVFHRPEHCAMIPVGDAQLHLSHQLPHPGTHEVRPWEELACAFDK